MNIRLLGSKILDRWRDGGIRACYCAARKCLFGEGPDAFDLRFGTDTSGVVPLWRLKTISANAAHGHRYEATDGDELERAISLLHEDLGRFTFVDLGCGKGRTLVVASRLGFGKIVGVEFAPRLAEIARRNLATLGLRDPIIVQKDVADFDFPDSALVVYLFNPFSSEVLGKVIGRLRNLATQEMYIVYNSPECADILDSSGFMQRFGPSIPTRWTIQIWQRVAC
jgi:SAM-dependent methyltransferase